jgi:formamidopyrimidine-DNA glycosylase
MPELPEVESIKIQLEKYLIGHEITKVEINYQKCFEGNIDCVLAEILTVRRFAKVLVLDLANHYSIVIQVKMTGQLIYRGPNLKKKPLSPKVLGGVPGKHTHVIFYLDRGGSLYYNDVRKFGNIKVIKTTDVSITGLIGKLGPEPLRDLSREKLKEIVQKSKQPIKLLLMDQTKLGGVGNIYANDALWVASINPKKISSKLTTSEIASLFKAIEEVLVEGIKRGGASDRAYVTPDGGEGEYQNFSRVYGRMGEKCKRCGAVIEKLKFGGRGTYFCPHCQA